MPNEVYYVPVNRDNGERVATNGYYTGHKNGTPTQAKNETISKYSVEETTIRYGTMMGDVLSGSMPKTAARIIQVLPNCTSSYTETFISNEDDLSVTYTANEGKTLPTTIEVYTEVGKLTVNTDYTWNKNTGILTVPKGKFTVYIQIVVEAS